MALTPTEALYSSLQMAYDHFNTELFDGRLPNVIFTMQRQQKCMGYLSPDRWASTERDQHCHELAINPSFIGKSSLLNTCQTLVHEACHVWQYSDTSATPSRNGYHNTEWALKMEGIGLMPSHTGLPGGKKTGQKMSDYPILGGQFLEACRTLITVQSFRIPWFDRWAFPANEYQLPHEIKEYLDGKQTGAGQDEPPQSNVVELLATPLVELLKGGRADTFLPAAAKAPPTRTKYQCDCKDNIWGKPGLKIKCETCKQRFLALD
ncbi:SprT-like domain-containing protein [Microbulbifer epialgicus]|uniref:SprT-like domain-containing protein n=1 Tax=Microbulbifer epialgicus TaxID=393907 RepID=A0ABV4NUE3_9GAMM